MKKSLGIITQQLMKTHSTYYRAIIELFSKKDFHVTMFTDVWFQQELYSNYQNIEFITKKDKESFYKFYRRILKRAGKCDLVIIEQSYGTTLSQIFGLRGLKSKKLYTIHNVITWLAPTFSIKIRALFRNLAQKFVIDNVDGVIVVSDNMKNFITSLNLIGGKPVFYLPFSLPKSRNPISLQKKNDSVLISMVVPGTIDPVRRDFHTLLDVFEKVIKGGIENINLVLLGRPMYEREGTTLVIEKVKQINNFRSNSIIFWEDYAPQSEFDYYLKNADFFISNLNIYYPHGDNYEIYGVTKETAIPTLMFEYRKPCIVIGDYKMPEELKRHVISVTSEAELEYLMKQISEGKVIPNTYNKDYDSSLKNWNIKIQKELNQLVEFI